MTLIIFKNKEELNYKDVSYVTNSVKNIDGKPVFSIRFTQNNDGIELNIDDITGFEVHES